MTKLYMPIVTALVTGGTLLITQLSNAPEFMQVVAAGVGGFTGVILGNLIEKRFSGNK